MSFYGNSIIFDNISSEEFGLMLVGKLDNEEQEGGLLGTQISIIEDTILKRPSPIYYASEKNDPLEFKLVLSVYDGDQSLSRYDLAAISSWLYGYSGYKELVICQPDLEDYFYRCKVTEIDPVIIAGKIIGLTVSIRCDAPFAYMRTVDDTTTNSGTANYLYHNYSNMNGYYLPKITIIATGETNEIQVANISTGDTAFVLSNIPTGGAIVDMDCLRQILSSNEITDVYNHCNFNFPAFTRGTNNLQLTGNFTITIRNEFPMYVGG